MIKAFTLIELIFSLLILSLLFVGFSLYSKQYSKNIHYMSLIKDVYNLEYDLYKKPYLKIIKIDKFDGVFLEYYTNKKDICLVSLKPSDKKYLSIFK